jgi:hypothetical protein
VGELPSSGDFDAYLATDAPAPAPAGTTPSSVKSRQTYNRQLKRNVTLASVCRLPAQVTTATDGDLRPFSRAHAWGAVGVALLGESAGAVEGTSPRLRPSVLRSFRPFLGFAGPIALAVIVGVAGYANHPRVPAWRLTVDGEAVRFTDVPQVKG